MEKNPHLLIEGMVIASHAIGAGGRLRRMLRILLEELGHASVDTRRAGARAGPVP